MLSHLKCIAATIVILSVNGSIFGQSFGSSNLNFNGHGGVSNGTSLMYGPDGRLYVLSIKGQIDIYTVQRNGVNDYVVTSAEEITAVKSIPNHNDDGTAYSGGDREATGLTVAGTSLNPVIYVTSSDSRIGGPGGDKDLDTNSGVITRLTWNGNSWDVVDIVRGLPRSEENHATNGLEFATIQGTDYLIVCQGGHTNAGSPSDNFAWTTEYALSAAILSVNLTMIESMAIRQDGGRSYVYDIPTLDDPTRPNVNGIIDPGVSGYDGIDVNDPFGGNDGLNQGMLVIGGPVQILSPGYRNSYDLVLTEAGKLFVTDNGANGGWGGLPKNEGLSDPSTVTNEYLSGEPGSSSNTADGEQVDNKDHLTMITDNIQNYAFGSFYGGHPTPVRANPTGAGLFTNPTANATTNAIFRTKIYDPSNPGTGYTSDPTIALPANWPPVPPSMADAVQGDWRAPGGNNPDGPNDVNVTVWNNNTNGIDEYTAPNFGGAMQGNLIAGKGSTLWRVELNPDGSLDKLTQNFVTNVGNNALGITCNGVSDPFPGTIWVAPYNGSIIVLEPQDFVLCIMPGENGYDPNADNDFDGYSNADEVDNNSDICNGGSQPSDFDKSAGGTLLSDLKDLDDDNDGISDATDPFQLGDPDQGGSDAFDLPVINELLSGNEDLKGYLGLGFTGLMNNGDANPNWLNWLDVIDAGPNPNDILGGAVGAMTMQMTAGTADGTSNSQEKAFQYGVNVDQNTSSFVVEGRLFNFVDPLQLYGSSAPPNGELGLFIGDGTQSNFIKFVLTTSGIEAVQEINDVAQTPVTFALSNPNRPSNDVILRFEVNANTGVVTLKYSLDSSPTFATLGSLNAQGSILAAIQQSNIPLAVGLIGSSNTPSVELEGTWDYLNVRGSQPTVLEELPALTKVVDSPADDIDLDNHFDDDDGVANLTYTIETNTNSAIGASILDNVLTLTYPSSPGNTNITIRATDGNGLYVEQTFNVDVQDVALTLFRINANGPLFTDNGGEDWSADNYFDGGSTYSSVKSIANTSDDELYHTERYGNFSYDFPVSNGDYTVNLHFAEIYFGLAGGGSDGGVGSRVFNVNIEGGGEELTNYDIFADVGPGAAVIKSFPVTVSDGELNIVFTTVTNNAKISAIEILSQQNVNTPISWISTVQNQTHNAGQDLDGSLVAVATGGDGNLQYSATGLPYGVYIEPTNGNIYGTIDGAADQNSPYTVTVFADDSDANSNDIVSFSFTWTINASQTPDTWTNITNNSEHTPRHENSFVQVGDKFYLFGGRESADKMDIYDYQTDTWTQAASTAPFEFNHFQATEYQGLIWVIGAFQDNAFPNETPADHIYMYDPATDTWIQGPEIPSGRKRGSAALVMHNDKFYVVAGNTIGHNGGYIPWFDEFDPATGVWTPLADAPHARDHFHATVLNNKLYVVGGRHSGGSQGTFAPVIPEVDVYDFGTKAWSTLPANSNLPNARAASATVSFQGEIYVIGGEGNGQAYANTDALNVNTNTWVSKDDLNHARHGTQGIVSGNGIWITSGSPNQGGGNQTNMEVYGVDNPSGTLVVASTLEAPASAVVPVGSTHAILLENTSGNQGIYVTSVTLSGAGQGLFSVLGSPSENFLIPAGGSRVLQIEHTGSSTGDVANLDIDFGSSSSVQVSLTSGQPAGTVLYRVNAGGGLVVDAGPLPDWSGDEGNFGTQANSAYLSAASTGNGVYLKTASSAYTGPIVMTDPSLPSGTPAELFDAERWDNTSAPEMKWEFPVAEGTQVEVRLYFAELYSEIENVGERVFDVSIEGVVPPVFDDIDQFERNGPLGAFMLSHTLTVIDGTLDIEFIHGVENPNIKAIEILGSVGVPNEAPMVNDPGTQSSIDGDVVNLQIQATDVDDCGDLTYSATGLPPSVTIDPGTGVISGTLDVGTGGGGTEGAFIESDGLVIIEAETDFTDNAGGWNLESGTPSYLVASTDHFGNTNGQTLTYDVDITTPGVYRLHMKSAFSGSSATDQNDTWFKINNSADVHFFCVQGGALTSTAQFLSELGDANATTKVLYYPKGNAMGRADHGSENPGNNGYFKMYRSGGGGNKWDAKTIDNNGFPVYAYFPDPGTYTISMSERSLGHKIDRFALAHIDEVSTGVPTGTLDGAESDQATGGTLGASYGSPYDVEVTVSDNCIPASSTIVNFDWVINETAPNGVASALLEITPGLGLGASTYGANSLQLTNNSTGNLQITSISIDLSTGILPDMVFDPVGAGGDETASCLAVNSGGTDVGYIVPSDNCTDPFSQPRNGGYDVLSASFADFDPSEQFNFTVDVDPNSIKDVPGAGGAGSVSGFELTASTVTITFSDGTILVSSLYEDGSLGGGQTLLASNALPAPTIAAVGVESSPACVASASQIIEVSGTPGANVSLLAMDTRLYIQSGANPYNVPDPTFYANEAMAKALYTGVIGAGGTVEIPVNLLETVGTGGTPGGGLNHLVAVLSSGPYAVDQHVSQTSNVLILKVDPSCAEVSADININATLQARSDHSGDYFVRLYGVGSTTLLYDLIATADAAGNMSVSGITPGTYQVAVKYPNSLQKVQVMTLEIGENAISMGQLTTGDANGDNYVSGPDFSLLATTYNKQSTDQGFDGRADFNGDTFVSGLDFSILATVYNTAGEFPSESQ